MNFSKNSPTGLTLTILTTLLSGVPLGCERESSEKEAQAICDEHGERLQDIVDEIRDIVGKNRKLFYMTLFQQLYISFEWVNFNARHQNACLSSLCQINGVWDVLDEDGRNEEIRQLSMADREVGARMAEVWEDIDDAFDELDQDEMQRVCIVNLSGDE